MVLVETNKRANSTSCRMISESGLELPAITKSVKSFATSSSVTGIRAAINTKNISCQRWRLVGTKSLIAANSWVKIASKVTSFRTS